MLGVSGLFSDLDVEVELDAPLGSLTWYGVGGRADVLLRPNSVEALGRLVHRCRRSGSPLRVLGRGANLLIADEGVDGVVVQLDTEPFQSFDYRDDGGEVILRAGAGADIAKTLMDAARRGLEGLSQMAGIPSSVGGALRMNAGGAYGSISDSIETITCLNRAGEVVRHTADEVEFGYRSTSLTDPIVIEAEFRMYPQDPITLRNRIKKIFEFKKSTQPLAEHSAGCAFKNPFDPEIEERVSAGRLIDEAGLKGHRVGGAVVSSHHANFITVQAGSTATDVRQLMDEVRQRVYASAGIELENEIVLWGRGDDGGTA